MTAISANRNRHGARRSTHGQAGFTLLEIMATVGLVALVLLPILSVREAATNKAWRASRMLQAAHHAEQLLARRSRAVDPVAREEGFIEEDPVFRYELTLENYDLSTGLSEEEEEEREDLDGTSNDESLFGDVPSDAAVPDADERNDPHKVRRFEIKIYWPAIDDEQDDAEFVLEGYLPRVWKDEPGTRLLQGNNR